MGSGPRAWPFRPRHIRNSLLFGGVAVASLMLGLAMWQGGAKPAQAATAQATIGVGVRVLQDCSALLDSSTTIIAASFACRGSPVAMLLSPTVSSTSLAILAPMAFSGQTSGDRLAAASGSSAGGVPLSPAGSISVRSPTSNFVTNTDETTEGRIVTITY